MYSKQDLVTEKVETIDYTAVKTKELEKKGGGKGRDGAGKVKKVDATSDFGEERINRLLREVGLDEAADRETASYSGGMKRRLCLACTLITDP